MELEVDLVNSKQMVLTADAYYLLRDGAEPILDMDAPQRVEEIRRMFPMGVVILDDAMWLDCDSVRVTIATYREKEPEIDFAFDYDFYYQMTNDLTMEVKWGPGRKSIQGRYHRTGEVPNEYFTAEVKETKTGKQYFQSTYGSVFWLTNKYMRIKQ